MAILVEANHHGGVEAKSQSLSPFFSVYARYHAVEGRRDKRRLCKVARRLHIRCI